MACVSAPPATAQAPAPSGAEGERSPAATGSATPAPDQDGDSGDARGGAPGPAAGGSGRASQPATADTAKAPPPADAQPGRPPEGEASPPGPLLLATPATAPDAAGAASAGSRPDNRPPSPPSGGGAGAPDPNRTSGTAQGRLTLSLLADPAAPGVRDVVTVVVLAASAARVVDAPLHLLYDPARLRFADAFEGDYLNRDGSGTVFLVNGVSRPGDVVIGIGRVNRSRGVGGSGTLCRVRFQVLASGVTRISIGNAMAWGDDGALIAVSGGSVDL